MRKVILICITAITLLSTITATAQNRYRYWFDTPGSVESAIYGTTNALTEFNLELDVTDLDPSIHTLSFQIDDGKDNWGDIRTAIFIRTPNPTNSEFRNIKIFIDQKEFIVYPYSSNNETFTLDLSELSPGVHSVDLYVATVDAIYPCGGGLFIKTPKMPTTPVSMIIYMDGQEYEKYSISSVDEVINVDLSRLAVGNHSIFAVIEDSCGSRFPIEETQFYWEGAKVLDISLDITTKSVIVGETFTLTATVFPEYAVDKTVLWNSDNEDVATVGPTGCVTAISEGTSVITATCGDVSAQCLVTVLENSGIDSIGFDGISPLNVYSLQGIHVGEFFRIDELTNLEPGIYIIIYQGKAFKVNL